MAPLDLEEPTADALADRAVPEVELADVGGEQPVLASYARGRLVHRQALDADHPAERVGDQSGGAGLPLHADASSQGSIAQRTEERLARGALAVGAVTAGGGRGDGPRRTGQLVAGVVEVVVVRRVRRLVRRRAAVEGDAVALEPPEHVDRLVAEAAQRLLADGAGGLELQVGVHLLGVVVDAGRLLLGGAAAGVHHAAADGCRSAAVEPVEHQHVGAGVGRLDRGAGPGAAEPDDHDVGCGVPRTVRHGRSCLPGGRAPCGGHRNRTRSHFAA